MIQIASQGLWLVGKPPFGYKRGEKHDNRLYVDEQNASVTQMIFEMYISDQYTTIDICRKTQFSRQQILNILRNRAYLGKIIYAGHEFDGKHSPIIENDLFESVQGKLPDSKIPARISAQKYPYLLTGTVRCHCGCYMTPASAKSGQYHYYRCTDNSRCKNRISAPALETAAVQTLQTVPFSDEIKKRLLK